MGRGLSGGNFAGVPAALVGDKVLWVKIGGVEAHELAEAQEGRGSQERVVGLGRVRAGDVRELPSIRAVDRKDATLYCVGGLRLDVMAQDDAADEHVEEPVARQIALGIEASVQLRVLPALVRSRVLVSLSRVGGQIQVGRRIRNALNKKSDPETGIS